MHGEEATAGSWGAAGMGRSVSQLLLPLLTAELVAAVSG